ncbi:MULTISPECIES: thiamine pyrophosphate-requiring protein [unclassified Streptomyces]|uniref:thiamine pyrophosphate-requiring protein n=1 Tax=unclassified Streptomyces TaxID=2593676 RepID=UPI0007090A41|nr:thiamine pyrophosphate-requiring protein [Streptomyces sp. Root264]KRD04735.1 thiamine pyrophosphate-binding protein [Streptomyces sp. Root264]
MSVRVSDHVLRRLRAWGVEHVFGYPGSGLRGLLAAWGRAGDEPRFVQARHEETSALQAVGYAKFSGRLGVCAASSGPGAVHLLNGLYDAKLDRVPVLAIVGTTDPVTDGATDGTSAGSVDATADATAMSGTHRRQVDLDALFADVASEFMATVTSPEQLRDVLDRAIRTAYARRCPVVVVIPADVQDLVSASPEDELTTAPDPDHGDPSTVPSTVPPDVPAVVPSDESLRKAAEILNSGDKVAILAGQGAAGARAEVERIAELLGAGVAKALLGKDVLSDELPYVTGAVGPSGTRPSYELMRDCDTLLTIGSSFPYAQYLPDADRARGVRIDVDPRRDETRHPYEVNLVGDAKETLRRLIPMIRGAERGREWFDTVCANVRRWDEVSERRAGLSADPINPEYVARVLDPLLPPDAIVACDSGSVTTWYARCLRLRPGMRASLSGTLATMGCAVPYAIGAKFAHPDRPAIALVGDGAMQMNGLAELITAARYRDRWRDPRLVVAVWNNRDLNQGTWEMRAMEGAPSFLPSQELPDVPYAQFARSLGLTALRVERPEDVEEGWRVALEADGPALVEFLTDPAVPPLPPHTTWERLEATAASILAGDADRGAVIRQGFKAKVQEFLPGREPGADTPD